MQYSIPRPVFNKLEKSLGDKQAAEELASSMESAVNEISRAVEMQTVDKMKIAKSEIKDDLTRTLVTRELFEEKFNSMESYVNQRFDSMESYVNQRFDSMESYVNQRFDAMESYMNQRFISMENQMDQRFRRLEEKMDDRFKSMQNHFEERFKRTDLKFHILIGISIVGFTLLNPDFLDLIRLIFK